ncbi:MAG: M42 family metallopeptidase [Clostridiaceae bacterium]
MKTDLVDILEDIISIPSPTGYYREINEHVTGLLDEMGISYTLTNKGGILAKIQGATEEAILFSAHCDTLGAMVKEIKPNGRIKAAMIGGCPWVSLDAENCSLRTSDNKRITGTFQGTKPSVHIDGGDVSKTERNQDTTELVLDIESTSKKETEDYGVNVGDFIFIDPKFTHTENGFIKSRYLDDKASVAILLKAMSELKNEKLKNTIYFFITNYEEVGHGASSGIPASVKEFIAVDMGAPGNGQESSEYAVNICAKDSTGPFDLGIREKLTNIAKKNGIPYRIDIYNFYGSDASAAQKGGYDIRTGLIGAGVFASHGYERTHRKSMEATLELVKKYAVEGL